MSKPSARTFLGPHCSVDRENFILYGYRGSSGQEAGVALPTACPEVLPARKLLLGAQAFPWRRGYG